MKSLLDLINDEIKKVFNEFTNEECFQGIVESQRPELCDYQINSCFKLSKLLQEKPIEVANKVKDKIKDLKVFDKNIFTEVNAVEPAFVNLKLNSQLIDYWLFLISKNDSPLTYQVEKPLKIILDYGGANVAKPLHIGHLRSAVIGEAVKRLVKKVGNTAIGDVHLGDYGLQMGLVIEQLMLEQKEKDFTLADLEEAYPKASKKAKEIDEKGELKNKEFNEKAHLATKSLQEEKEPYYSIWKRIMELSIADLKRNYSNLNVFFDLWKGESDVDKYIASMLANFESKGYASYSNGALVIDVKEDTDKLEVPPLIVKKQDGSYLYATTDLATLLEREKKYNPDEYIYIVDKRQSLYLMQMFRASKKTKIVPNDKTMIHIGFGTMNGKDNTPFKTREGGVLKLETLIKETVDKAKEKLKENGFEELALLDDTAKKVAISSLKYGDLSNQAQKDYIFDIDRFLSFEGNTGPYILYTIVRINSIFNKLKEKNIEVDSTSLLNQVSISSDKTIQNIKLCLLKYDSIMKSAYENLAPDILCKYIYELSNVYNSFYHSYNIINEQDKKTQYYLVALSKITRQILLEVIDILGFECPNKM